MASLSSFSLPPVQRLRLATSVTDSLREAILSGGIPPVERVAEARLAESLEVSRATVREALATLEQEGLVERRDGGTFVARLSREDAVEVCTLRHTLEALATRLAMAQPRDAWLRALEENLERTRAASGPSELAALDLDFHELIVRGSGHKRLWSAWLALRSQIRLIMNHRNAVDPQSHDGTLRAHGRVLELLRGEDPAPAVAQVEHHLQAQQAWILRAFDTSTEETNSVRD